MSAVDARKEHYEAVEILGIPGLFTTLRVDYPKRRVCL